MPLFIDPRGNGHFDGGWRPVPLPARPVAALVAQNRARGVQPDAWTCGGRRSTSIPGRWKREAEIPDEILLPALAAVG
jgi:hypothetical protein